MQKIEHTPFSLQLRQQFVQGNNGQRPLARSTADAYLAHLIRLNHGAPLTSLAFLLSPALSAALPGARVRANARQSYVCAILRGLRAMPQTVQVAEAIDDWSKLNAQITNILREYQEERRGDKGYPLTLTPTESAAWQTWPEIGAKRVAFARKLVQLKTLAVAEQYLVACVYTLLPPRRTRDFDEMVVAKQWTADMPTDRNYYDIAGTRFIFNVYKTAKQYGQQIYSAVFGATGNNLRDLAKKRAEGDKLFRHKILGTLHAVFGKGVGTRLLRHIYITDKFAQGATHATMFATANWMAHSVETQAAYLRRLPPAIVPAIKRQFRALPPSDRTALIPVAERMGALPAHVLPAVSTAAAIAAAAPAVRLGKRKRGSS